MITRCDICGRDVKEPYYVEVKIWKNKSWTKRHDICLACIHKLPEYIQKEHMKNAKD